MSIVLNVNYEMFSWLVGRQRSVIHVKVQIIDEPGDNPGTSTDSSLTATLSLCWTSTQTRLVTSITEVTVQLTFSALSSMVRKFYQCFLMNDDPYLSCTCSITLTPLIFIVLTRGVTVEAASDVGVSGTYPSLHSCVTHVVPPVHALASLVLAGSSMDTSSRDGDKCGQ